MCVPATRKRQKLSQSLITELIWDSECEEVGTSSISSAEDEGGFEDQPGVSCLQPDCPTCSGQISGSSISGSASEGEQVVESGPGQQVQMPSTSWTWPHSTRTSVVHTYTGCKKGKKWKQSSTHK
jgi:hypothetical protein